MKGRLLTLPFALLASLNEVNIWNIVKIGWGRTNNNHEVLKNNTLKVYYPKGSYSPSKNPQGGIGFYASPKHVFPTNEVELTYQVKFDDTFQPNLGGKLPGLFLGTGIQKTDMVGSSGGQSLESTASIRVAWRKDFKAEAYVYVPRNQTWEYYKNNDIITNGKYGDSLWRNSLEFNKEDWNTVNIYLKLNTLNDDTPNTDGILKLTINNTTKQFDKLIWRTNKVTSITSILFSTFFGGSSNESATPNDTWIYFRSMTIRHYRIR